MILDCQNICKSFGDDVILNKISLSVNEGDKIALIGENGAGKSTLMKIITGEYTADSGVVSLKKDATLGYLSQHQDYTSPFSVYEELEAVKKPLIEEEDAIRQMEEDMDLLSGDALEKHLVRYHERLHTFDLNGGYTFRSDITGILKGLKFSEEDYTKPVTTLSGGERTRLLLGRILLEKPDLILLDEPTNYLDMDSVEWLENYLSNVKSAVLFVSHDRYFINKTATAVMEIRNASGLMYEGNYDDFMIKKEVYEKTLQASYENEQRMIKHQEEVIAKLRSFNREKSIRRADSRQKMLDKLIRKERPDFESREMEFTLSCPIQSGKDVLKASSLTMSYGDRNLFNNVSFEIKRGEHIALIGKNGCGKTTILKIINDLITPQTGEVTLGSNVIIGYFDQQSQVLEENKTIFDEISDTYPRLNQTEIRNVLASFLFTDDDVFKKIKLLSGGERGRVVLAKLMLSKANFLILDEPTNHLDMSSKEILENALNTYEGTVLYVSHDRYFINQTADKVWHLSPEGLSEFLGNYDYYLEKTCKQAEQKLITPSNKKAPIPDSINTSSPNSTYQKEEWEKHKKEQALQRKKENRIKEIEARIETLEKEVVALEEKMSDSDIATQSVKMQEIYTRFETKKAEISALFEEWEQLS